MPNINVRGISDQTKEALRVRAAKAGMSLEAYARRALKQAASDQQPEPVSIVTLAEKYFGCGAGVDLDLPSRTSRRKPVSFNESDEQ